MRKKCRWNIIKPAHNCFLEHLGCNNKSIKATAFLGKDNKWRCPKCGKEAPKEMALMADLCYCYPMPRTAAHYYEKKNKENNVRTFRKICRNYF